ncbi:MAG TPA: FAD-dependent oxidoreductase [Candidatus Caccousia stercoris]|uniref:FAD-dependent oxidoreductase n=1 Tax=Candidatus Caccousia stercoris TaxID=2840723 RepID=A0A9D1FRH3_9FIRM|nr:FAD-dependent oxidoreductase [Candidatus Caccousia stercoris]
MNETLYDVIVVGGGPAGLAAALEAAKEGAGKVLILERNNELGGILNQCIHNGFGLQFFKEELTGPEYAGRFIDKLADAGVEVMLGAMVLDVSADKTVHAMSREHGYMQLRAKSVVLNMGCRERTRGAIAIPGDRPAGVFTAGAAQLYMNIEGYMVGKRVVILGSGDIGLIMARRMTLEGAKVLACVELMPYSNGLNRNIVQCLNDYDIPLYLSHTIVDIKGDKRVEQVVVAKVDEKRNPIPGTEITFDCDTVLLSVGLIPENELSRQAGVEIDRRTNGPIVYENMETSIPGVFASGNVVHVHDLVDFVTQESQRAGRAAALYAKNGEPQGPCIAVENGSAVTYTVPQKIRTENVDKFVEIFFRVNFVYTNMVIQISSGGEVLARFKREHMAPGEMEKVAFPKALFPKIRDRKIAVSVVKEEDAE